MALIVGRPIALLSAYARSRFFAPARVELHDFELSCRLDCDWGHIDLARVLGLATFWPLTIVVLYHCMKGCCIWRHRTGWTRFCSCISPLSDECVLLICFDPQLSLQIALCRYCLTDTVNTWNPLDTLGDHTMWAWWRSHDGMGNHALINIIGLLLLWVELCWLIRQEWFL